MFEVGDNVRLVHAPSKYTQYIGQTFTITERAGDPIARYTLDGIDTTFYASELRYVEETRDTTIDKALFDRLSYLGLIPDDVRSHNVGNSDYSKHVIQPWSIWLDYDLNAWDADIVKRVLRTKEGEPRAMDYKKIIHDCEERLRQLGHGV